MFRNTDWLQYKQYVKNEKKIKQLKNTFSHRKKKKTHQYNKNLNGEYKTVKMFTQTFKVFNFEKFHIKMKLETLSDKIFRLPK